MQYIVAISHCDLSDACFTGPNQTWEIGRVSMKIRWYVGNREGKNNYGIFSFFFFFFLIPPMPEKSNKSYMYIQ